MGNGLSYRQSVPIDVFWQNHCKDYEPIHMLHTLITMFPLSLFFSASLPGLKKTAKTLENRWMNPSLIAVQSVHQSLSVQSHIAVRVNPIQAQTYSTTGVWVFVMCQRHGKRVHRRAPTAKTRRRPARRQTRSLPCALYRAHNKGFTVRF